jgi:hypothetical protein
MTALNRSGDSKAPGDVDIVIRSYYKDFRWLEWCLRSIDRFCQGFRQVVLVVPESSRERLEWRGISADRVVICGDYPDDYLGQQVTKLHADLLTDATFICHVDSDCIFARPSAPSDLFRGGRPVVNMVPYSTLDRHVPWKRLTEQVVGTTVDFEFMRYPPYTFPRWVYGALRQHVLTRHGVTVEDYVMSRAPRGFSEVNSLCGFAYAHARDAFAWRDLTRECAPEPACKVFWSWGGLDAATEASLAELLASPGRASGGPGSS